MASSTVSTEAIPLLYPRDVTNESGRKTYKQKVLKGRPETLFSDLYKSGDVSNLILLTDQPLAWHAAINAHYPHVKKEGICNGWKLKIKEGEDPDSVMMTVNIYKNGTIMVQGNRKQFESDFILIKKRAQQEKSAPTVNTHILPDTDTTPTSSCPTRDQPPQENEPTSPEQVQDPQLNHTINDIKVKFTELERELVQLREIISQQPTLDTTVQQNTSTTSTQLSQDSDSYRRELTILKTEVRELQHDRENHMVRLTALSEELQERERPPPTDHPITEESDNQPPTTEPHSLIEMRDRFTQLEIRQVEMEHTIVTLQSGQTTAEDKNNPPLRPSNTEGEKGLSALWAEVKRLKDNEESSMKETRRLWAEVERLKDNEETLRQERRQLREEVQKLQDEMRTLTSEQPLRAPPTTLQEAAEEIQGPDDSPSQSAAPPSQDTQTQETPPPTNNTTTPTENSSTQNPQIVLLIDSNGRYVEEKKLFPNHRIAKFKCRNTSHAMELLREDLLGSPSHIIIHTGTNDLRAQGEEVAKSIKGVTEKASSTFPNAKVVISTLLPRWDFHPALIQRVNAQISRDCALKPNIYVAPHPTLDLHSLYDQVHILKAVVPTFAKTLKDVALNRRPSTSHRSNRQMSSPPRPIIRGPIPPRGHPAAPRRPAPTARHHTAPRGHPVTPQARPAFPSPTPYHTYAQVVSRASPNSSPDRAPPCDLSIHQMLSELYTIMVQA